jgi:tRNA(Met) C34 N-acetyltransferase TmcA
MKKILVLFATLGLSFGADQLILKKPPASSGKYYPPQSNKFEYVSVMHEVSEEYMRRLSDSMKALRIFLMQGDVQKAKEAGEQVVERVKGTEAICFKCHTDKTVVDRIHGKDHEQALASIQRLLKEPQPNKDAIFRAMSVIGQSCNRCHNLHLVPAMVQEAFRK